ncbi:hypothetical protein D3C80_1317450 [compost metagenome]
MVLAQTARDLDQLLHRIVARADDAGREKQPLDIVALVEGQRQVDDLLDREPRPFDVRGRPIDAVDAVVDAEVGQQYLQQADATPVRRIGVADPHALGRTHPLAVEGVAFGSAGRRARGVILGRIGQDGELSSKFDTRHLFMIRSNLDKVQRGGKPWVRRPAAPSATGRRSRRPEPPSGPRVLPTPQRGSPRAFPGPARPPGR